MGGKIKFVLVDEEVSSDASNSGGDANGPEFFRVGGIFMECNKADGVHKLPFTFAMVAIGHVGKEGGEAMRNG